MPPRVNGFTLVEMLAVTAILGLVCLIGYPRMSAGISKTNVRGARTSLINMLAKARTSATHMNRMTWLKVDGNRALVLGRPRLLPGPGNADTLGPVVDLASAYGVTVFGSDSIRFDPRGLGTGFGADGVTFSLSRGDYTEQVRVDGLGRVSK